MIGCSVAFRQVLLTSVFGVALPLAAQAATYTVPKGTTDTTQKSVGGAEVVNVQSDATLLVNDTAIKWNNASTALIINNSGTIESTASGGRAINAGGTSTMRTVTLNNAAGALIESQDDAFRINTDITSGAVTLNNAGTILSTAGGQAIDFDSAASTAPGQITVNNASTGVIQANDADAIRPGANATVTNAGLIYADGAVGDSHDGVDFQSYAGTVVNQAGGTISGERHGVVSNTDITVYNYGTITGRNGSGVNGDGSGYVINYGTITGAYNGSGTGDGDGVNINGQAYIENYGTINALGAAGVGNDGQPNYSDGVTLGSGTLINHAGATIYSVTYGVAAGDTYITNAGTIDGGAVAILLYGSIDVTIVNSGLIESAGGIAITGGYGGLENLVIERGSVIDGLVQGGFGYNSIFLEDGAVFNAATNFQYLQVDGAATLIGDSAIASVLISPGASLQFGNGGTAGSVDGAIVNNGLLSIDRSDTFTLANAISGSGGLAQIGSGVTFLTGADTYTGATTVEAGFLQVDGAIASSSVLVTGGTLQGTGTIGGLQTSGGVVAPAGLGAIGTLTVAGDVALGAGTLAVDLGANGASDKLVVQANSATGAKGAVVLGGELEVTASAGYTPRYGDSFQIITAAGGVSGSFSGVSDLSAILYPVVTNQANGVGVTIAAHPYASVIDAASPVQRAYAQLLDQSRASYPQMSTLYDQLDGMDAAPIQATLEAMAPSAEITASTVARMEQDTLAHLYRDRIDASRGGAAAGSGLAVIGQPFQLAQAGEDHGLMADRTASDASTAVTTVPDVHLPQGVSAFFAGGYLDGSGRSLPSEVSAGQRDQLDGWYVALGGEVAVDSRLTVGGAVAYVQGEGSLSGASTAKDDMTQFALYGSYLLPLGMFVDGQVSGGPARVRTTRSFDVGTTAYDLASHGSPSAEQAEFDLSRPFSLAHTLVLTPTAGVRYAHLGFGATTETGGDAALAYAQHDVDSFQTRLGASAKASFRLGGWSVAPKLDATYVHDFDADREDFGASFVQGGGPDALFIGPERARDWAEVGGGLTLSTVSLAVTLSAQTNVGRDDLSFQTYSISAAFRF